MNRTDAPNTPGWRSTLESVADALDKALGDTDITHIESDDELREVAPVQWACSQVNKLLQTPQSESVAWVACAVRLPEGDADVLAIDRDGKMHGKQAHSVRTDAAFAVRSGNKPFYTHWMPLPEAPK